MKKHTTIALSVLVMCSAAIGLAWRGASVPAKAEAEPVRTSAPEDMNPFTGVNEKARAAKNGSAQAAADLTSAVVDTFTPGEVPPFTKDAIKERLARAEVNYRKGGKKGLSESDVAKMVNELAVKLEAPDYAKTNPSQVRILRMSMTFKLPNLVAQDDGKEQKARGAKLPLMSPAEAYSLAMLMLQQKMVNEEFQVGPKEFAERIHRRNLERWESRRAGSNPDGTHAFQGRKNPRLVVTEENPKTEEMRQAVERGAQKMSPKSLMRLADDSLDTLGIER